MGVTMVELSFKTRNARPWNFALVFKSFDESSINRLLDELPEIIPDAKVVYRAGPTTRLLWVVVGSNPQRGENTNESK
jgi:hypothetical protein